METRGKILMMCLMKTYSQLQQVVVSAMMRRLKSKFKQKKSEQKKL